MVQSLIEDLYLRDKLYVFRDRKEAGTILARKLLKYKGTDGLVLGIPSGGVPVAAELAKALSLPVELVILRKIQIPHNTEAGFGAVAPDYKVLINEDLLSMLNLSQKYVERQIKLTIDTIKKRDDLFRKGLPFPSVKNKIVIIVDDGLASGYTMLSAVEFLRRHEPKKIVVAVPTGSKRTVDFILPNVDELICLNIRNGFTFAVADAYENWYDLTDNDVISILQEFNRNISDK